MTRTTRPSLWPSPGRPRPARTCGAGAPPRWGTGCALRPAPRAGGHHADGDHLRPRLPAGGAGGRPRRSGPGPRYTPRTLRHFFASTALAHGAPLHEVSRWLGHASIKTTVDIYGHLVPAAWERCRSLQQALGPASADVPGAVRPAFAHRSGRPPRLLDRCWIRSPESGFAQATAFVSMFRFNV
ncbi:tyrosine-type recombinase/integrase [Streptomyces sioyaensis]|uniref:tyrosine-type recombinase/integrase n=1 Tax=Streptomyces sioyaensis TaxID=67364 RepID=UPI0036BBE821